jgi:hypothetical protein
MEVHWYGKRDIDSDHAHVPAQFYFRRKDRFVAALIKSIKYFHSTNAVGNNCSIELQDVQECDATKFNSSKTAGNQKQKTPNDKLNGRSKLFQKPHIVFAEQTNIVDAIFE